MRWPQDRDGHTDEVNSGGCPGAGREDLNSWESIEVRWWLVAMAEKGAWNHICTPASQDLNCALINMQIELLPRWVPFSFQHTELEVTKKKNGSWSMRSAHSVPVDAFSFSSAYSSVQTSGVS